MEESVEDVIEIKLPKITHHLRKNPWIISTFVLGIFVLIFFYNSYAQGSVANTISENQAGQKVVDFLNKNAGIQATLKDVSSANGLYKVNILYQGQTIPLYATKDGKFFTQTLTPLDSSGTATSNSSGTPSQTVKVSVDDDAVLGNPNAPITIIEFTDYQCIFCRKFWTETFSQLKKDYIDAGKVKLVVRDFPLTNLHPMAEVSVEAAECVREKGGDSAYFKMHDKIFGEQNKLSPSSTASYAKDDLLKWANDLGYDISSCLGSGKYKSEVAKDLADAQSAGFGGTPGFVIMKSGDSEGIPIKGAYPYSAFQKALDAELAGKKWYADDNTGQIVVL